MLKMSLLLLLNADAAWLQLKFHITRTEAAANRMLLMLMNISWWQLDQTPLLQCYSSLIIQWEYNSVFWRRAGVKTKSYSKTLYNPSSVTSLWMTIQGRPGLDWIGGCMEWPGNWNCNAESEPDVDVEHRVTDLVIFFVLWVGSQCSWRSLTVTWYGHWE